MYTHDIPYSAILAHIIHDRAVPTYQVEHYLSRPTHNGTKENAKVLTSRAHGGFHSVQESSRDTPTRKQAGKQSVQQLFIGKKNSVMQCDTVPACSWRPS